MLTTITEAQYRNFQYFDFYLIKGFSVLRVENNQQFLFTVDLPLHFLIWVWFCKILNFANSGDQYQIIITELHVPRMS